MSKDQIYELTYQVLEMDEQFSLYHLRGAGVDEKTIGQVMMQKKVWLHPKMCEHFKKIAVDAIATRMLTFDQLECFIEREYRERAKNKFPKYDYFRRTILAFIQNDPKIEKLYRGEDPYS